MSADQPIPVWRRARACADNQCVEIAHHDGKVLIRDSKNPGRVLTFGGQEWAAFLDGVLTSGFVERAP